MDRQSAKAFSAATPYAEAFQLEFSGATGFHDIPGWCKGSS
jgi:hypothetical protein